MLVHRRVTRSINFAIPIYTRVERGTVRVKYTTQCPRPGLEPGPFDPETSRRTNHEATAPPTAFDLYHSRKLSRVRLKVCKEVKNVWLDSSLVPSCAVKWETGKIPAGHRGDYGKYSIGHIWYPRYWTGNVWQSNAIKHFLVTKHVDVILIGETASNMFERTKCFTMFAFDQMFDVVQILSKTDN